MVVFDPWPHVIVDGFLGRAELAQVRSSLIEHSGNYIVERRKDSSCIEYCVCADPVVYKIVYSRSLVSLIAREFDTLVRINPTQGIQFRRMRPETGRFPVHSDFQGGVPSFAAMLYLGSSEGEGSGGQLELYDERNLSVPAKTVSPLKNRLIVFETKPTHYHAVSAVVGWVRYMALLELERSFAA